MAITAFVGKPGHGKSYTAVELGILQAVKEGRVVHTNIPLKAKLLEDYPNADVRLVEFDQHGKNRNFWKETITNGSLVVLDELWRFWPSGLSVVQLQKGDDLSFIKEHRHLVDENGRNVDIILVTQDLADIAKSVYTMVETTVLCVQLSDVGLNNRFRRDYFSGAITGFTGKKSSYIRSDDNVKYNQSVFQYYLSHTKATGAFDKPNEKKVLSASIFGGTKFKLGVIFLFLMFAYIPYGISKVKKDLNKSSPAKEAVTAPAPSAPGAPSASPPAQYVPPPPPPPPAPKLSEHWRISGYFSIDGKRVVILENGRKSRRINPKNCTFDYSVECVEGAEIYTSYSGTRSDRFVAEVPLSGASQPGFAAPGPDHLKD